MIYKDEVRNITINGSELVKIEMKEDCVLLLKSLDDDRILISIDSDFDIVLYTSLSEKNGLDELKAKIYEGNEVSLYSNFEVDAYGTTTVQAYDKSIVHAYDKSKISAYYEATVHSHDDSQIFSRESSVIHAYDKSKVDARGSSVVHAYDETVANAYVNSTVFAYDKSTVTAHESSRVEAFHFSVIRKYSILATIVKHNNHFGSIINQVFQTTAKIIVYKKLRYNLIAVLELEKGQIFQSEKQYKCRTDRAYVVRIESIDGTEQFPDGKSIHDRSFIYEVGKTRYSLYDENIDECSSGIHFFLSRREAVEYNV
jgi:hypothetical protein